MIEDIHEPLELYKSFFKEAHARHTSDFFENLVRESGVDERANIKTVKELRELEQQLDGENATGAGWRVLRAVGVAALVISLVYVFFNYAWFWLLGPVVVLAPIIYKLNHVISDVNGRIKALEQQRDAKREESWQQMAPLNRLYDWDIVSKLVQETVPRLALDPYFANGRLDELHNTFGWTNQFNEGKSVVFAHSGVLNGNPFVLARTLAHWMGTKTYHGSLNISWTERERNSKGEWETVTHHQTLHASVEEPHPEYGNQTFIIFGNEAAPNLSFSRGPSHLSKLESGVINNWRKRRAIKQLETKSRDMKEGQGFAIMANREFDALFGATDRDHEIQFRLLFTPLAQQEMLKLLKDSEVGYGDNFEFIKQRMINLVESEHMMHTDVDVAPVKFQAYELAHARKYFNAFHNDFFKSFFFGIAPLLTIPLYQQHRSHADIYKDIGTSRSCFWEHEAIANHFGESTFQHPECVTRSILKTQANIEADGSQTVHVSAYGFKGINRTTYVSVYGGDGRNHDVRVDWVEYLDVQHDSSLLVRENHSLNGGGDAASSTSQSLNWQAAFQDRGIDPNSAVLRRSIFSAVLPN